MFKDPRDMTDLEANMWIFVGVISFFTAALFFMAKCR